MYANLSPRMRLKKNRVPGRGERLLSAGGASSTTVAAAKTARLAKRLEKCISSPLDSSTAQILDERHLVSSVSSLGVTCRCMSMTLLRGSSKL